MNFTVVLVGAGNMGGAMLRGWMDAGMVPENVVVLDPSPADAMVSYLEEHGIGLAAGPDGLEAPDVLLLAVKPQMMTAVLPGLAGLCGPDTVAVSVAAGTTIDTISHGLGGVRVVRAMPNTPSLVGRGMTVACPGAGVSETQRGHVSQLLETIGKFAWVDEEPLIDVVTGVSGSGPAYVFHMTECLAAAGKAAGLDGDLAMTLARQTVSGAGELLYQSSEPAATLRQNVTSPGGTTAAALEVLRDSGELEALMTRAVAAAANRARELS